MEDMENFQNALKGLFETLELDFDPAVLITHHAFSIDAVNKEDIKELVKTL